MGCRLITLGFALLLCGTTVLNAHAFTGEISGLGNLGHSKYKGEPGANLNGYLSLAYLFLFDELGIGPVVRYREVSGTEAAAGGGFLVFLNDAAALDLMLTYGNVFKKMKSEDPDYVDGEEVSSSETTTSKKTSIELEWGLSIFI